ncbi:MAG: tetratricopeptide repeat protein [Steroidobacter sp.]
MKRTQRNLFIIMAAMVAFYSIVTRLPWQAALSVAAAVLVAFIAMAIWGRDYFIGRRHTRRRDWARAVESYQRFEKKLLSAPWHRATVVLYLGIYSFDGVAITRNNIAQSLMNAGELDRAVAWLRSALLRDPLYAAPYVNLSVIAAMRRDEATARREMQKAVHLGFSPAAAQRILRLALEKGSQRSDERLD